jgi:hypothetical protein
MNKEIMKQAGLGEHVKLVEAGKCPFCKKVIFVSDFRNDISLREFKISGLCQKCQDDFFGKD